MKLRELPRHPGFYGWLLKAGGVCAALYAILTLLAWANDHVAAPITAARHAQVRADSLQQAQRAEARASRKELEADTDSIIHMLRRRGYR